MRNVQKGSNGAFICGHASIPQPVSMTTLMCVRERGESKKSDAVSGYSTSLSLFLGSIPPLPRLSISSLFGNCTQRASKKNICGRMAPTEPSSSVGRANLTLRSLSRVAGWCLLVPRLPHLDQSLGPLVHLDFHSDVGDFEFTVDVASAPRR